MAHPTDTQVGIYLWDALGLGWKKATKEDLLISLEYTVAIAYDSDGFTEYYGECEPGVSKASVGWRIRKYTRDSNHKVTDIQWASGINEFVHIWNNYSSYSYS